MNTNANRGYAGRVDSQCLAQGYANYWFDHVYPPEVSEVRCSACSYSSREHDNRQAIVGMQGLVSGLRNPVSASG